MLTLVPDATKEKVVRTLEDKHPILWEQAKLKVEEDTYDKLYEDCEREHFSCSDGCPVYRLAVEEEEFDKNKSNNCPYFKNGKSMYERLHKNKLLVEVELRGVRTIISKDKFDKIMSN